MVDKLKIEQAVRLLLEGIGKKISHGKVWLILLTSCPYVKKFYGGLGHEADTASIKQFPVENNEIVLEKDITTLHVSIIWCLFMEKLILHTSPTAKRPRFEQTGTYSEVLFQKTTDPGTAYCSDCRCFGAYSGSKRNYGNAGSGTYLTMRGIKTG